MTPDMADAAYANLLGNLPLEVAERLQQKYAAERASFVDYVAEVTPSTNPEYWAKRSCTKCYGRGILGELTKPNGEKSTPACSCIEKNYKKWLVNTRHTYNQLKKETGHEQEQTGTAQEAD